MKKSAIVFLLTYCIATFSFASFSDLELAGPSKFFSHKPFAFWSNDKIYSSFTAEPFEKNRLQVIFQDKDYTPANNIDFLKENFFFYHYYNPYKDNDRKVGEEIYFFIKKDDISYFVIKSNIYDHYSKQEDLKLLDFHFFCSDKKLLKTVTEASLKPEAEKLFKEAVAAYIETENNKKAEIERNVITGVLKMKPERNDPADMKTFQDFGKKYLAENFDEDCELKKVIFLDKNWTIFKNDFDRVLSKAITVGYFYKNSKDGHCYFTFGMFGYEFDGAKYDSQLIKFNGSPIKLNPEDQAKTIKIYPKNTYIFPCENIK